jgi:hypothetical protein
MVPMPYYTKTLWFPGSALEGLIPWTIRPETTVHGRILEIGQHVRRLAHFPAGLGAGVHLN